MCPYKGTAKYRSVRAGGRLHRDVAWSYPDPIPENSSIAGPTCFYNEKVDLTVDGVREARPDLVVSNMDRLEAIVARLPEAERVDIAEWGDHPTSTSPAEPRVQRAGCPRPEAFWLH